MAIHLVVQVPFWQYERGSMISDPAEIEKALEHHSHFVTRVAAADEPMVAALSAELIDLQTRLGPEKSE